MSELSSNITFEVERETAQGSRDYSSRECRIYRRNAKDLQSPLYERGYVHQLARVGPRVAIIPGYFRGQEFDQLGVNTVVEIDGGPVLEEPVVFEVSTSNTAGMTLTGISVIDNDRTRPDQSMESVMLVGGGQFIGPVKAGFVPREITYLSIGKTLDGKDVRIAFQDVRPITPVGISPRS